MESRLPAPRCFCITCWTLCQEARSKVLVAVPYQPISIKALRWLVQGMGGDDLDTHCSGFEQESNILVYTRHLDNCFRFQNLERPVLGRGQFSDGSTPIFTI